MGDVKFEIKKTIGVLSEGKSGWRKELNIVSWNGKPDTFDIRYWSADHKEMGKGCTFTREELIALKMILNGTQPQQKQESDTKIDFSAIDFTKLNKQ